MNKKKRRKELQSWSNGRLRLHIIKLEIEIEEYIEGNTRNFKLPGSWKID